MRMLGLRRQSPTISLSALVDVLFILIVFVILAANFDDTRALDIELPGSSSGRVISDDEVKLVVSKSGAMRLAGQPVDDHELQARLRAARGAKRVLLILADGDLALRRATALIEAGSRAGFDTVSLATLETTP